MTQHDPWRASALAWRTGGDYKELVGAVFTDAVDPLNLSYRIL
jgi:hypothetical protein